MKNLLKSEYSTPRREKWIKRLLSGLTKKTKGALVNKDGMCCLGVELECQGVPVKSTEKQKWFDGYKSLVAHPNPDSLGIKSPCGGFSHGLMWNNEYFYDLANLNDTSEATHVDIGQFIIENQEHIFKKVTKE